MDASKSTEDIDGAEAPSTLPEAPSRETIGSMVKAPSYFLKLGEDDVLLGRGTGPNETLGNVRFRKLVNDMILEAAKGNNEPNNLDLPENRSAFSRKVVNIICKERRGLFVRKLSKAEVAPILKASVSAIHGIKQGQKVYVKVSRAVAAEKTKQALRHQLRMARNSQELEQEAALASRLLTTIFRFFL